jgi:uncharacterized membrane protein
VTSAEFPPTVQAKKSFLQPGGLFLILGLLVGIIFCIAIPYGAGFDEETHMARIFEISGLALVPNTSNIRHDATFVPNEFFEFSYQRRYFQTSGADLFIPNTYLRTVNHDNLVSHRTSSIYPPIVFLPQAFVAGISWRLFDFPVLPFTSVCRMAGLLVYLLGTYVAIRTLPFGKWVMALLALAPMAMFQASTLNADGFTNVISFLFIAVVLKYTLKPAGAIGVKQALIVAALCLTLGLTKQGGIAIIPVLFVLPFQKFASKKSFGWVAAGIVLAVFCAVGWSLWALPNSNFGDGNDQSVSNAAAVVLANPVDFLTVFIQGVTSSIPRYYFEWIGVYGHWIGVVPSAIYWIYPLALLAAFLSEPIQTRLARKTRIWIVISFLIAAGATTFLFYFLYYRPGGPRIIGMQGRYLTPLVPLLFLPLAGLIPVRSRKITRAAPIVAVAGIILSLALYGLGIAATYYSDCGKTWYTTAPCQQPIYKNIEKASAPEIEINTKISVSQSFTLVCGPLESFEIYVKPVQSAENGSLHFALFDPQNQLVAESEIKATDIDPGTYLNFPIRSQVGKPGEIFNVQLDSKNLAPQQGIKLGTTIGKNYTQGKYFVSGVEKPADLIFHYNCANPWAQLGK